MALKKSIVSEEGFGAPSSYSVVEEVRYAKGASTQVSVVTYKDKASRDASFQPMKKFYTSFSYNESLPDNIIKQAYGFLKSIAEFSDAEDV